MRTLLIGLVTAGVASATVAGQNPPPTPSPPQTPTTQTERRADTDSGPTVTVQGCLMREADVPGLESNVIERAGVTEDFVITSAKVLKGRAPEGQGDSASRNTMFEVEGLSENQLEPNLNRRVEIDGTIEEASDRSRDTSRSPVTPRSDPAMPEPDPDPRGMTPSTPNTAGDLAQLQARSIRAVPGDCPTAR